MKTDITTRSDIEKIIGHFYEQINRDEILGPFFSEVMSVSWEKHIRLMGDFWENVLFYTGDYNGDPLTAHKRINILRPTRPEHFERWLDLFSHTVDSMYKGKNAAKMKKHARGIAAVMQEKVGLERPLPQLRKPESGGA